MRDWLLLHGSNQILHAGAKVEKRTASILLSRSRRWRCGPTLTNAREIRVFASQAGIPCETANLLPFISFAWDRHQERPAIPAIYRRDSRHTGPLSLLILALSLPKSSFSSYPNLASVASADGGDHNRRSNILRTALLCDSLLRALLRFGMPSTQRDLPVFRNSFSAVEATASELGMFILGAAVYATHVVTKRHEGLVQICDRIVLVYRDVLFRLAFARGGEHIKNKGIRDQGRNDSIRRNTPTR